MAINKRTAMLVGINDYPGSASDLPSCVDDVAAMADVLERIYGFEVNTLLDGAATYDAVRLGIEDLTSDVHADDRVVFFYSGHGTTAPLRDAIQECLFLADGSLLPDDDFVARFAKVPPGTALVVLDSCFSGGMAKLMGISPRAAPQVKGVTLLTSEANEGLRKVSRYRPFGGRRAQRKSGREADESSDGTLNALLLAACQEGETAMASTPATMGLSGFTYALLSTLALQEGPVSVERLLSQATAELRRIGIAQTPAMKTPLAPPRSGERDFPLLLQSASAAAPSPVPSLWDRLISASAHAARSALQPP